jgi:hypothetical protein
MHELKPSDEVSFITYESALKNAYGPRRNISISAQDLEELCMLFIVCFDSGAFFL